MESKVLRYNQELDSTDLAILSALQKDSRRSNVALAESVFLSSSCCHERVKKLEQKQYICGYGARLNEKLLGFDKIVFIQVTLERTTESVFMDFKLEIMKNPLVIECHMVTGGGDYLLKVYYSDMDHYRTVLEKIVRLPGVMQAQSSMVIEQIKSQVSVQLPISSNQLGIL